MPRLPVLAAVGRRDVTLAVRAHAKARVLVDRESQEMEAVVAQVDIKLVFQY